MMPGLAPRALALLAAALAPAARGSVLLRRWEPSRYISHVAKLGGLAQEDTDELLDVVKEVSGPTGSTFLLTVTTVGMVDLAQNMLRSLDAVPADLPRLVIGIGSGVCESLGQFSNTVCVDVYRDDVPDEEVAWGSPHYYRVVLRKHVVLSIVSLSGLAKAMVFSDPDLVYFANPGDAFRKLAGDHDIMFSSNNYLEPNARKVSDLSKEYETRGTPSLVGFKGRHMDINSGCFYMKNSSRVNHLWMETLKTFIKQESSRGHYQQFSLNSAIATVPNLKIGVAPGDVFVNGNVFWGHRELLKEKKVVSVHANWMQPSLKRTCLDAAGLWIDPQMAAARFRFTLSDDVVEMDDKAATVTRCSRRDA